MALVFVAIAALGAGAGLAWWLWSPGLPELARGWPSTVVLLAGDGVRGRRDGEARQARFSDPFGIATAVDGTIYVSDGGESHRIRRITADGRVTTVAGGDRGFVDGPTTEALIAEVQSDGRVWCGPTQWGGATAMRIDEGAGEERWGQRARS